MPSHTPRQFVEGESLRDTWRKVVEHIKTNGRRVSRGRIEVQGVGVVVSDPLREKRLPNTIKEFPEFQEHLLLVDALVNPSIVFCAGQRLKTWSSRAIVLQVDEVCEYLRTHSHSNRAVMVTINAEEEFPMRDDDTYDFPTFMTFDFKLRDKLSLISYLRMCDVIHWWPVNFLQLSRLLDEVSRTIDKDAGEVMMMIGAAYMLQDDYDTIWKKVGTILGHPSTT